MKSMARRLWTCAVVVSSTVAAAHAQFDAFDAQMASLGGPNALYGVVPPGTTSSTILHAAVGANLNMPLPATSSIVIAGSGYLWDVDVQVNVAHVDSGELDLVLIAPNGKRITLSTDNAGGVTDAFVDTSFDDSSTDAVLEHLFAGGQTLSLVPEGALGSLLGIDPQGTWQLEVLDDTGGASGTLVAWALDLTTLTPSPTPIDWTVTDFQSFTTNIPDNNPIGRTGFALIIDAGAQIRDVRARIMVQHARPSDLVITLESPAGTMITLTNGFGGSTNDAFGDVWFQDDVSNGVFDVPVSEYDFAMNGPPSALVPVGAMNRFAGELAEGAWVVHVVDHQPGVVGRLLGVQIEAGIWDVGGTASGVFCPSGVSVSGCIPPMANSGTVFSATGLPGQRIGIFFFGVNGPRFTPWAAGSTSVLCVRAPLRRLPPMISGGTSGQCDGSFVADSAGALNAAGVVSGTTVYAQCWYRDPPAPKFTNLTNAVMFTAP